MRKNCHLSETKPRLVVSKMFDLYEEFKVMFSQKYIYRGKNVIFSYPDDCRKTYSILMTGHEQYHNSSTTYDFNRVRRVHWIAEILNKLTHCLDNELCGFMEVKKDTYDHKAKRYRDVLYCPCKRVILVLELQNDNTYKIITFYYKNK